LFNPSLSWKNDVFSSHIYLSTYNNRRIQIVSWHLFIQLCVGIPIKPLCFTVQSELTNNKIDMIASRGRAGPRYMYLIRINSAWDMTCRSSSFAQSKINLPCFPLSPPGYLGSYGWTMSSSSSSSSSRRHRYPTITGQDSSEEDLLSPTVQNSRSSRIFSGSLQRATPVHPSLHLPQVVSLLFLPTASNN
jgi:hypothetical protein